MNLSKLHETVEDREAWHAVVHAVTRVRQDWMIEQLPCSKGMRSKKTELKLMEAIVFLHYNVYSSGFECIGVSIICFSEKGVLEGMMGEWK